MRAEGVQDSRRQCHRLLSDSDARLRRRWRNPDYHRYSQELPRRRPRMLTVEVPALDVRGPIAGVGALAEQMMATATQAGAPVVEDQVVEVGMVVEEGEVQMMVIGIHFSLRFLPCLHPYPLIATGGRLPEAELGLGATAGALLLRLRLRLRRQLLLQQQQQRRRG